MGGRAQRAGAREGGGCSEIGGEKVFCVTLGAETSAGECVSTYCEAVANERFGEHERRLPASHAQCDALQPQSAHRSAVILITRTQPLPAMRRHWFALY